MFLWNKNVILTQPGYIESGKYVFNIYLSAISIFQFKRLSKEGTALTLWKNEIAERLYVRNKLCFQLQTDDSEVIYFPNVLPSTLPRRKQAFYFEMATEGAPRSGDSYTTYKCFWIFIKTTWWLSG